MTLHMISVTNKFIFVCCTQIHSCQFLTISSTSHWMLACTFNVLWVSVDQMTARRADVV